jgi:hypothetical protein
MNITISKKEEQLENQVVEKKVMPKGLTLYFESFTTDQMRSFILSSSEEIKLNLTTALKSTQTKRLSTILTSRDNEGRRKFEKEVEDNVLNGEAGKATTKNLRSNLELFSQNEVKDWTDSLLDNVAVKLKRNLVWIKKNSRKIALKKKKKAAREKARRLEKKKNKQS